MIDRFDIEAYIQQLPERVEPKPKQSQKREGVSVQADPVSSPEVIHIINTILDSR